VVARPASWEPGNALTRAARPQQDRTTYSPGPAANSTEDVYTSRGRLQSANTLYQSVSVDRNASFDLSIKTAQGDIASIRLTQQQRYSAAGSAQPTDQGLALQNSDSLRLNVQFRLPDQHA